MAYRKRFCDDCGIEAPQNEMHPWERTIEVARESDTVQTFATGKTGYRSGKVTYRTEHLLLCGACYNKIQAELERQRREEQARLAREAEARDTRVKWTLIGSAVVVLFLIGLALVGRHGSSSGTATVAPSGSSTTTQAADSVTSPLTASPQEPSNSAGPFEQPPATAAGGSLQGASSQETSPIPAAATANAPANSPTDGHGATPLGSAITTALDSGQETPWADGESNGTVSVGPLVQWRGRSCRTYGFTTNGAKSAVTTVCQVAGQGWQRAN